MTMAPVPGLRYCPNKGKPGCLGVIEIGSHCFMCVACRGNKPCSLALPCGTCKDKILRNAAEVRLGSARAASNAPSGDTPPSKRTRSKGSEPTMPNGTQAKKPKKAAHALLPKSLPSADSASSVSSDEISPPLGSTSDSASSLSLSSPSPPAGGPISGSSEVESEEEGDEAGPRSVWNNTSSSDADVVRNSPSLSGEDSAQPRSDVSSGISSDARSAVINTSDETLPSSPDAPPPYSERASPPAARPPILKKSKAVPLGAWLHRSDGSVEQIPIEQYKKIRKVAFGLASHAALPDSLQPRPSSSGGSDASGTANVSDGCLAGPSRTPTSDPEEEEPLAVSTPRADPVSPQPGPSTSRGTGTERIYVDPSTGARNRSTGHRSGGAFRIYDEENPRPNMDSFTGHRSGGAFRIWDDDNPRPNTDNTYAAGEGGYSDEEDEDAEEEDQGSNAQEEEGEEDTEISRIDYRGVIEGIRRYCNIQPREPEPKKSKKVGYEKRKRPEPAPRTSLLLPWSDSVRDNMERASAALARGQLNSARGARLFRPTNPGLMRFYRPEDGWAAPADLSEALAEYLNDEIDNLNRIATSFNPNETRDMGTMIANATAALSWTDLALQALAPMPMSRSPEDVARLDHHLVALSRAVGFVMENLIAMWANWELKRRDALLLKVRDSESKTNRRSLRDSPLFQPTLFNDERIRDLQNRLVSRLRDNLILSAARPPSQKRQQPSNNNSQPQKKRYSQPSRGARGGFTSGTSNRGRGGHVQPNNNQQRDSSQDSSSDSSSSRRGRGKGKGPAHKKKGGRGRK